MVLVLWAARQQLQLYRRESVLPTRCKLRVTLQFPLQLKSVRERKIVDFQDQLTAKFCSLSERERERFITLQIQKTFVVRSIKTLDSSPFSLLAFFTGTIIGFSLSLSLHCLCTYMYLHAFVTCSDP